jgi:hypothetical protein
MAKSIFIRCKAVITMHGVARVVDETGDVQEVDLVSLGAQTAAIDTALVVHPGEIPSLQFSIDLPAPYDDSR